MPVAYGYTPDQWRVPGGNGELSGRWIDMPGAILADLDTSGTPSPEPNLKPATDADLAAFKETFGRSVPPAWTDVQVDLTPGAELRAKGRDGKGRLQFMYSDEYHARRSAEKYERLSRVFEAVPALDENLSEINGDPTRAAARLMYVEGIRVGSTDKQRGNVQAYGATTVQTRHAEILDNGNVRLAFTAKEGIPVEYEIDDPELVNFIRDRLENSPVGDERIFDTSSEKTINLLREASGLPGMRNHDLRTLLANRIASAEISKRTPPVPRTKKEFTAIRKEIATVVSDYLRNKPAQALTSYINPAVFAPLTEGL